MLARVLRATNWRGVLRNVGCSSVGQTKSVRVRCTEFLDLGAHIERRWRSVRRRRLWCLRFKLVRCEGRGYDFIYNRTIGNRGGL